MSILAVYNEPGATPIDYSADLAAIRASVAAVDTNTDNQEARLDSLITNTAAGNTSLLTVITELQSQLAELQSIEANTDEVESKLQELIDKLTNAGSLTPQIDILNAGNPGLTVAADSVYAIAYTVESGQVDVNGTTLNAGHAYGLTYPTPANKLGAYTFANATGRVVVHRAVL